jgi:ribonuclease HI
VTFTFPKILAPLREYLRGQGADVATFVSARQAAFVAQQLIGSRVKFPPHGQDMTAALLQIQEAVPKDAKPIVNTQKKPTKAKLARAEKHHANFTPDMFATGIHIFCDGAAVPNPGVGGWGVVVFRDSVEIGSAFGGRTDTTNNVMELTAILNAINEAWKYVSDWSEVTIWCDSQYCVKGCNEWMAGWKAKGWQRGSDKAEPKNRELANADLWKAIDAVLADAPDHGSILIKWVKGHIGVAGNERADVLAEMGRQAVADQAANLRDDPVDDLDERYRQIMGAL